MFYVLLPDRPTRDARARRRCASEGITPTFHYVPLHNSDGRPAVLRARTTECPVTDDISGRLLRLPFYNNLTAADSERVIDSVPQRAVRSALVVTQVD